MIQGLLRVIGRLLPTIKGLLRVIGRLLPMIERLLRAEDACSA